MIGIPLIFMVCILPLLVVALIIVLLTFTTLAGDALTDIDEWLQRRRDRSGSDTPAHDHEPSES